MKRSLKELSKYTVETKDGAEGKANDFLFDEKQWIVRYFDADFGSFFNSARILIPKVFLKQPMWEDRLFPIEMTKNDFEKCPKPDDHLPISRKYEDQLYRHYRLNPYWATPHLGVPANLFPPRPINGPSSAIRDVEIGSKLRRKVIKDSEADNILRSFKEVEGYHIKAKDGKIGHIEDIIIDDSDWQIIYAVIDTANWLPWSKKVLIGISWIESISYLNKEVNINLKTDTIESMPEYKSSSLSDESYERKIYEFFNQSLL